MGFTVSEKFTCPRCTDALNITISGKFHFLQNLRFNVCTTMTLLSMGAGWFYNQSPIYAYLQKAALTLRLILEALPIPSRRHRLRVWVMYLSIKVLLRRSPGWVSVVFSSNFDHFDFELTFKIMILGVVILKFRCQLLNISIFCKIILSIKENIFPKLSLGSVLPLSPSWPTPIFTTVMTIISPTTLVLHFELYHYLMSCHPEIKCQLFNISKLWKCILSMTFKHFF